MIGDQREVSHRDRSRRRSLVAEPPGVCSPLPGFVKFPAQQNSNLDLFTIGSSPNLNRSLTPLAVRNKAKQVAIMLDRKRISFPTEKRTAILKDSKCRLLTPGEFCNLLISRFNLERSDETDLSLAGLRDRETGQRYFVELEKLRVFR